MGKKKAAKKKAAKKKASRTMGTRAAETVSCSDGELGAAQVVTAGGELLLGLAEAFVSALEARDINVAELLAGVVNTQGGTGSAEVIRAEDSDNGWALLRLEIEDHDRDRPYLRFVGKVVEVLTVHRAQRRGKDHCSQGEVFLVFLKEIPQHSPYDPVDYRLLRPTRRGNEFAVTRDPGKTMFAGRLHRLKEKGYLTPANTTQSGGERGYRLSNAGRMLFDGWPDVEGLHLDPPDEHE